MYDKAIELINQNQEKLEYFLDIFQAVITEKKTSMSEYV